MRIEVSQATKGALSPSDSVKSASSIKGAVLGVSGPRYGRPAHHFGPPTALFSQPLALLKHHLDNLESLTPDPAMLDHAFALIVCAAGFFQDEVVREAGLRPLLRELLVGTNEWQRETMDRSAKPDGVWLQGHFAYLIVELKNESGLGGDPSLQGLVSYGKIVTQDEVLFGIVPHLTTSLPLSYII